MAQFEETRTIRFVVSNELYAILEEKFAEGESKRWSDNFKLDLYKQYGVELPKEPSPIEKKRARLIAELAKLDELAKEAEVKEMIDASGENVTKDDGKADEDKIRTQMILDVVVRRGSKERDV